LLYAGEIAQWNSSFVYEAGMLQIGIVLVSLRITPI